MGSLCMTLVKLLFDQNHKQYWTCDALTKKGPLFHSFHRVIKYVYYLNGKKENVIWHVRECSN
jgi:hypothetical protein